MSQELMYLQQLFGQNGGSWLAVTMLVGLLLALIFRPNTIHNLVLFRFACVLLAVSMVVAPIMNILLNSITSNSSGGGRFGNPFDGSHFLFACTSASGPLLQAASVFCGLFSLIPPFANRRVDNAPAKHPME